MTRWPIILRPKRDELLSSWLIRSSIALGTDPVSLSSVIWGDWRPWTVDIDRSVDSEKLEALAKLTGLNRSKFENMTLRPIVEQILGESSLDVKKAWPWVIPTGNRNRTRTNGLHFCPLCLSEATVYFRKSWRYAWNVGCHEHGVRLVGNCPSCNAVISPHLATYKDHELSRCMFCHFDLTLSLSTKVHPDAMWLQILMNEALKGRFDNVPTSIPDEVELFEIVHYLIMFFLNSMRPLKPYKRLHQSLGIDASEFRKTPATGVRIEAAIVAERESLMVAVARLLKLPVGDAIHLLASCGVTQQMFMIRKTKSKFIERIKNSLVSNSKAPFESKRASQGYKPRTKEEVDHLMSEIEKFL